MRIARGPTRPAANAPPQARKLPYTGSRSAHFESRPLPRKTASAERARRPAARDGRTVLLGASIRMNAASLGCLLLATAAAQAQSLGRAAEARARTYDLQHVRLDLSFDLAARGVSGIATLRVAALRDGLKELVFDAVALDVSSVTIAGRARDFANNGRQIKVRMEPPLGAAKPIEVSIRYSARPRRGLYFVLGEPDYPQRPRQIYSQGFPEDNRYWFPLYDFPNDKTTSEIVLRVPAGWEAMSNGRLVEKRPHPGGATFHWLQEKPHSTYLISFAAGEFDRVEESWRGLPLAYYVPRGGAARVQDSFGRTAAAMELFSQRIGPYPWARYSQGVLQESIYGGMENTGAVTYGPGFLLEEGLVDDEQAQHDITLAHELAHQWFGDLITVEDFRHLWLSEGFATFLGEVWAEHRHGAEETAWRRRESAGNITGSAEAGRYPLVRKAGETKDPVGLLAYQKGAWMVHMIRRQLGEELFWRAMRRWVSDYGYQNARSADLAQSIARSTGRNLDWLFDQFAYAAGHPQLEASWRWETGKVRLRVRQKSRIFNIPVGVELAGENWAVTRGIRLSRAEEEFALEAPARPQMVLIDPDRDWLMEIAFDKTLEEWLYQLTAARRAGARADALAELRRAKPTPVAALARTAAEDPFWGVRLEAVSAVASLPGSAARGAVERAVRDPDRHVRAAAVAGLARENAALSLLEETARKDSSSAVRAAAVRAIGSLKPPGVFELLQTFLAVESPRERVRSAAVSALAQVDDPRATRVLLEWGAAGKPEAVRAAALAGLGAPGRGESEARALLEQALTSASVSVRKAAIGALRRRGERQSLAALQRAAGADPMEAVAELARSAAEALATSPKPASAAQQSRP